METAFVLDSCSLIHLLLQYETLRPLKLSVRSNDLPLAPLTMRRDMQVIMDILSGWTSQWMSE